MYDSLDDLWALPRTRDEAIALGSKVYFTGKPCKHGHLAPRGVGSNRGCRTCNKVKYDLWREQNPDKSKLASNRWKERNTEAVKEYRKADYTANAEYYRNKQRIRRQEKSEETRAASRNWFRDNPHKRSEYEAKRRSRIYGCVAHLTYEEKLEVEAIYAECKIMNKFAGTIAYHVDHIKPLSKGGTHHPSNLQILTAEENIRKNAHWSDNAA